MGIDNFPETGDFADDVITFITFPGSGVFYVSYCTSCYGSLLPIFNGECGTGFAFTLLGIGFLSFPVYLFVGGMD